MCGAWKWTQYCIVLTHTVRDRKQRNSTSSIRSDLSSTAEFLSGCTNASTFIDVRLENSHIKDNIGLCDDFIYLMSCFSTYWKHGSYSRSFAEPSHEGEPFRYLADNTS
jgi:hypothetical protein